MADVGDIFLYIGERGPPLREAIHQLLIKIHANRYPKAVAAAALAQVGAHLAGTLEYADDIHAFARSFDSYARQLRELARAKADRTGRSFTASPTGTN